MKNQNISTSSMCPPNDDAAKLREYSRLDQLHREQISEEMQIESESNTIRQNAGGFSLVNVLWASFATKALAIFVVAIIALAVLVAGCVQRGSAAASIDTASSCLPLRPPSSLAPRKGSVPLSPAAPLLTPQNLPSGSGPHPAGQATLGPICPLPQARSSSFPSLSSHQSVTTDRHWKEVDIQPIPSH